MRKTLLLGAALAALFAAAPASAQNVNVSNIGTSNLRIGDFSSRPNNGFGTPSLGNSASISGVAIRGNTNVDNYRSANVDLGNTGTLTNGQGFTGGNSQITTLTATANPTVTIGGNLGGPTTSTLTNSTSANAGLSGVAATALIGIPNGANTANLGTNISGSAIAVGAGVNGALTLR